MDRQETLTQVTAEIADAIIADVVDGSKVFHSSNGEISFAFQGRQIVIKVAVADTTNHTDPLAADV